MTNREIAYAWGKVGEDLNEISVIDSICEEGYIRNKWFIPAFIKETLESIRTMYLQPLALEKWVNSYFNDSSRGKSIGMILAGNIPAVGFHDVLCGICSGAQLKIKLSSKDDFIIPYLLDLFFRYSSDNTLNVEYVTQLKDYDAVIATGSSSGMDFFKQYLTKYPHILRGHRNSVAILHGDESEKQLRDLGEDIFFYFGLGCRNVSKLYIPEGYDIKPALQLWESEFSDFTMHNKYMNNYDYNKTLLLLNRVEHLSSAILHVVKNQDLHSRISTLHLEEYNSLSEVEESIDHLMNGIQCISTDIPLNNKMTVPLGKAQSPGLTDYADYIDTMKFLKGI